MTVEQTTVQRVELDLQAGLCLRLTLECDPDGEPECLELALGWAAGGEDGRRVLRLPGHVLPALTEALVALGDV